VGRFLEHSRIFRFENGGAPRLYLGSGDWMTRNLRERVEVLIPVSDADLRGRLEDILGIYWADNAKTHLMTPGGGYTRMRPREGENRFEAQAYLMQHPEGRGVLRMDAHPRKDGESLSKGPLSPATAS
jgi:polyphosphate kinase